MTEPTPNPAPPAPDAPSDGAPAADAPAPDSAGRSSAERRFVAVSSLLFTLGAFLALATQPATSFVDSASFQFWGDSNFAYASSPIDLSVISPVQGVGGLVQPTGVWLHPAYLATRLADGLRLKRALASLVMMLVLGAACYALARAMGVSPHLAVLGAQLLAALSFPPLFFPAHQLFGLNGCHLYYLVSSLAFPVALGTVCVVLAAGLGHSSSWKGEVARSGLIMGALMWSFLAEPLYSAVFLLPIGAITAAVLIGDRRREVLRVRLIAAAGIGAALLLLQVPSYYLAVKGYAARATFPNEIYGEVQTWDYLTTLPFQGKLAALLCAYLAWSAFLVFRHGTRLQRAFALATAGLMAGLAVTCLVYVYGGTRWSLPLPVYFEVGLHPAYVVLGLLGASMPWRLRGAPGGDGVDVDAAAASPVHGAQSPPRRGPRRLTLYAYGALVPGILLGVFLEATLSPGARFDDPSPSACGSTVGLLRDELALRRGDPFRGRVALLAGVPGGPIARQLRFPDDAPFTKQSIETVPRYLTRTFDRNLFLARLWQLGIPTLENYDQLASAPLYYVFSRALCRPGDYQSRNWILATRVEPSLMALLGTRYVVTDQVIEHPLAELIRTETNVLGVALHTYQLRDPNVGDYSPTRVTRLESAQQVLAFLRRPSVSLREEVAVFEDLPANLVPADAGSLACERGGVRVRARSRGQSLLLLPLEFSNSLRVHVVRGSAPRLVRANLLLTGLLFEGEVEVVIQNVFGLFRGVSGRQADILDVKRLGITEDGTVPYPPGYQPNAIR